jgi:hypothetical protein
MKLLPGDPRIARIRQWLLDELDDTAHNVEGEAAHDG